MPPYKWNMGENSVAKTSLEFSDAMCSSCRPHQCPPPAKCSTRATVPSLEPFRHSGGGCTNVPLVAILLQRHSPRTAQTYCVLHPTSGQCHSFLAIPAMSWRGSLSQVTCTRPHPAALQSALLFLTPPINAVHSEAFKMRVRWERQPC